MVWDVGELSLYGDGVWRAMALLVFCSLSTAFANEACGCHIKMKQTVFIGVSFQLIIKSFHSFPFSFMKNCRCYKQHLLLIDTLSGLFCCTTNGKMTIKGASSSLNVLDY